MKFPVETNQSNDFLFRSATEGRPIGNAIQNNLGAPALPADNNTASNAWRSAVPPTVTANGWKRAIGGLAQPAAGRMIVIRGVTVETTSQVDVALLITRLQNNMMAGASNGGLANNLDTVIKLIPSVVGSSYVYKTDFGNLPLALHTGDRLDLFYISQTTSGTNWEARVDAVEMTDCMEFNAPYTILVVGDSICLTADITAVKVAESANGTYRGMWPFILQDKLRKDGQETHVVNLGQGGMTSTFWDWFVNVGRIHNQRADLLLINLGMNDAASDAALIIQAGNTETNLRIALKNIVRAYFRKNPKGSAVINNITPTDLPTRLTAVAAGPYTGIFRILAARSEIVNAVNDLAVLFDVKLADTSNAFPLVAGSFISSEAAGSLTHPNDSVGQPAMADIIYTAVKQTKFWNKTI